MQLERSSGVLLHPTSLPGGQGIGDIGPAARTFIDRLAEAQQAWWQVLPLNPPDFLGSPYSATSAMAMSPNLIDLAALATRGWLQQSDLPTNRPGRVDFDRVTTEKDAALRIAYQRADKLTGFDEFSADHADWLDDWSMFAALRGVHGGDWRNWPEDIVRRDPDALEQLSVELADEIRYAKFVQWIVREQWSELRAYAMERGVRIIGDVPIFVAMDSADVWAERDLFKVDAHGNASVVAGVPPDYFSPTGQKWGNPVYRWDRLAQTDYAFWKRRLTGILEQCDIVRIDHFRGFESYWEVPAEAPTAEIGAWRPGPNVAFFKWVEKTFGDVPFIAEDLGLITDEVHLLRDRCKLPGMKVMQFAFDGDPEHPFLPHTYPEHCVAYTGTHDNDTTWGWYSSAGDRVRHRCRTYLSHGDTGIVWSMIESLMDSDAALTIVPFQDLHSLGAEARLNLPGTSTQDNWSWRMTQEQLADEHPFQRLGQLTERFGR